MRTLALVVLAACGSKSPPPTKTPEPAKRATDPDPAQTEMSPPVAPNAKQAAATEYTKLVEASRAEIQRCFATMKVGKSGKGEVMLVTKFDSGGGAMTIDVIPSLGKEVDACVANTGRGWKLTTRAGEATLQTPVTVP